MSMAQYLIVVTGSIDGLDKSIGQLWGLPLKLEVKTITKKILITEEEKRLAKSKLRKVARARAIQRSKQRRRTWKHRYLCEDRFWLPASFDVVSKQEPETSLPDDSLASVSCPHRSIR